MGWLNMKPLSTEEILKGLDELKVAMKTDEDLDKRFTAVLEDAERRIRAGIWVDYTKGKPEGWSLENDVKVLFKLHMSWGDQVYVDDFYKRDEINKRNIEEDGLWYDEGQLVWKLVDPEYKMDIKELWSGLCELDEGIEEDEYLEMTYSDLINNIMARVHSSEWRNIKKFEPVCRARVIYKIHYCSDWWEYGESLYDPETEKIINITMPELCEEIWWKPLEIEDRIIGHV